MRTVLKNLVDGLSEAWIKVGSYWRVPCKSSITEARQRIGSQVITRLFHLVVRPLATVETPEAFLGGLRVMAVDGTIDTEGEPEIYRLITSLTDIALFPALLLAMEYHKRWEIENTIDELKVHLLGRKTLIRSLNPREVVQEIYGWLLGHWAVRSLMFEVADHAQISPLRLSFTGTLNVVRRAIPKFQRIELEEIPFF
jgi:Insertion element 4 transposase N-terminal